MGTCQAQFVKPKYLVERRTGYVDIPFLEELLLIPVQEGEDEQADVRSVHVRIRHDDDAMVTQLLQIELHASHPQTQRGDHGLQLCVLVDLSDAIRQTKTL